MVVLEAFLSALFEILLNKLVADPLLEYARRLKVDRAVLQGWTNTLLHLQAVLHDAEQRQIRDEAVKRWLDDLKALAYDIEDVLDEFEAEAKGPSLVQGPQTSSSSGGGKVRNLIPSFHPSGVNSKETIGQKIERITQELEAIEKRTSYLRLSESVGGVASVTDQQRLTTFLVDEVEVYGRDGDKEKIIELLLSDELATADKVQVIPIVGMGGVGKTTLAQIIYNDDRMQDKFHCRVWVCVSDQFDLIGITKSILESVSGHSSHSENLSLLQASLQKELNGKRFFLVLDDIWNENPNIWSTLQAPLKVGAQGSVIIVTTRNEQVASIMRTASSYPLSELSDEHCWSLFSHRAFENITPDAIKNLEPIGRKIIQKCKGLPLAAKTLGGLLRSQQDEKVWKEMMNNEIWDLPNILPALHLSYHYLPTKVKQCFAYCSIFPKDYEYQKEELILLWVAQGFVGDFKGEDGEKCFRNLLSRSFFQQSSQIKSWFVMHDLIHDLAQFVSREFCFRLEVGNQKNFSKRARHLSYDREKFDVSKKFDPLHKVDKLRTFLPLGWVRGYLADKVLRDLLPKFRCLRVLSLSGYNITHLPADLFQNLKHLRYLNLSSTNIRNLPKSIGMLCNLQSLMLSDCHGITELPPEIENLIHLHHLDISGTKLEGMPTGINKLKDLRRLTTFVVGKHSGARITELQDLSHLRGALSILNLQNVVNAMDALKANLKKKEDLDDLVFAWDPNVSDNVLENQTRVLENLQPHTKVKRLRIRHYYGTKFPKWLGDPSFMNLVFLRLGDCKNCLSLPPLGQLQSLKYLWIVKMDGVQNVGADFYGNNDCDSSSIKPFGSLEILRFEEMLEWEEWVCRGVEFPCLKELYIKKCPKLKKVGVELYGNSYCSSTSIKPFGSLEILRFEEMLEWEEWVCRGVEFPCLKELYIKKCPKLKKVGVELYGNSYCSSTSIKPFGSLEILRFEEMLEWEEWVCRGVEFPCLKELYIKKCPKLKKVGVELYGNSYCSSTSIKPFGSLEILRFEEMLEWEEWVCRGVEFPCLKELYIKKCPKLKKVGVELYGNSYCSSTSIKPFGSLEILRFEEMLEWEEWVCHGVEFPCLKELYIKKCPKLKKDLPEHLPKLTKLQIWGCEQLVCCLPMAPSIRELELQKCDDVMVRSAGSLTSLASLHISNVCKIPDELGQLNSLVRLNVIDCPELKEIPPILHSLTSLKNLNIQNCESLASFPEMALPPMLERLEIRGCPTLESLPEGMMQNNTTLQLLVIGACGSLRSLPRDIDSLKTLAIYACKKLELALQEDMTHNHYASLTKFEITGSFDSFTSFPLASFTKLEDLIIMDCGNLESLYIPDGLHHVDLTSLQSLEIWLCPNLVSFPRGGLPTPNLRRLSIENCKKLKSLPQGMHTLLTSLQDLNIDDCPEIDSFPEGGLPTNLSHLHIRNCNKLLACRMEWWGLQTLPFLRTLGIEGYEKERFPEERFLPSTLTSLEIRGFPNLKSLDNKGFQHLTSLETLWIAECGNLKSFPKQGLPSSLSRLKIVDCPLLRKRCQRDKGKEWPKISHIPCIAFDQSDMENGEVILS